MERRNTSQYKLISNFLYMNYTHPTAEEVYAAVVLQDPHISFTTVYRNLNKMVDEGKILRISLANEKDRFDYSTHQHCHISCQKCHQFMDVNLSLEEVNQQVKRLTNFKISGHSIVFYGLCPDCQKKGENAV